MTDTNKTSGSAPHCSHCKSFEPECLECSDALEDARKAGGADLLAKMHVGAVFLRSRGLTSKADDLEKASTAVAALIERNVELEAERDVIIKRDYRGLIEQVLRVVGGREELIAANPEYVVDNRTPASLVVESDALIAKNALLTADRDFMVKKADALAAEVKALRAERDGLRSVVNPWEVLVEVHGLTGSGKSAVAGEIEILCKALGLDVRWENGDEEKFLTHADWTAALELYAPRVRIVEINTPRPAAIDAARASAATGGSNG